MLYNRLCLSFNVFPKALFLLFIISISFSSTTNAQDYTMGCGTKYNHQDQSNDNTNLNYNHLPSIKEYNSVPDVRTVLPVVIHILKHPNERSIDDKQIGIMLSYLNQAFTASNNQSNVREAFVEFIGNPNIEFNLISQNQNGSRFNGILRKDINEKLILDRDIKSGETGSEAWDTEKVVNIWICDLGFDQGSNVAGYSSFPSSVRLNLSMDIITDGIVLDSNAIGYYGLYSTLVHEMGHYLGLNHPWGNGSCEINDGIEDTPPCSEASKPDECSHTIEQCEVVSMHENFMDYSKCRSMFTKGQVNEMHRILHTVRKGLLHSNSNNMSQIDLYPNPCNSQDRITVKEVYGNSIKEINVYSVNGQRVKSLQYISDYEHVIETQDLSPGLYFIQVKNEMNHEEILKMVLR